MPTFTARLKTRMARIRAAFKRQTVAYGLLTSFILFTSVGTGLIFVPAGFIVAGISCGVFGFLLGLE